MHRASRLYTAFERLHSNTHRGSQKYGLLKGFNGDRSVEGFIFDLITISYILSTISFLTGMTPATSCNTSTTNVFTHNLQQICKQVCSNKFFHKLLRNGCSSFLAQAVNNL